LNALSQFQIALGTINPL